jgi:hypothetical protein
LTFLSTAIGILTAYAATIMSFAYKKKAVGICVAVPFDTAVFGRPIGRLFFTTACAGSASKAASDRCYEARSK